MLKHEMKLFHYLIEFSYVYARHLRQENKELKDIIRKLNNKEYTSSHEFGIIEKIVNGDE